MITVTVIHCWSAPRSRSTALLYSFEARGKGCVAIDEPLYRRWIIEKGESVSRPYTQEIIRGIPHSSADPSDYYKWIREKASLKQRLCRALEKLERNNVTDGVIFIKHMAKHSFLFDLNKDSEMVGNDLELECNHDEYILGGKFTLVHRHLLLIRDPVAILSSWDAASEVHNTTSPDEVGIIPLLSIYSTLYGRHEDTTKRNPIVIIDSDQLAADPAFTLWQTCKELNIPYTESMLSWESGPHDCDGCWAKWWYLDVHSSKGWFGHPSSNTSLSVKEEDDQRDINYPPSYVPTGHNYRALNPNLMTALRLSIPAYLTLKSLTPNHVQQRPPPEDIYEDARNRNVLVWVGASGRGQILPRDLAGVSPFDSVVQGGDAVWEGIRVYHGRLLSLDEHILRLFKSAKALGFSNLHTKEEIIEAIFRTLASNDMRDGVHIRLTLTRGEKSTSSMNPKFNVYGTTLIILPEWKPVEGKTTYDNTKGISLVTSSVRRNSPSTIDSKIHHNNLINNILAKIHANMSGAADAIMLDLEGFVSETNATNLFMVEDGILYTPSADHCLPGITRKTVLTLAQELGIVSIQRRISLAEFQTADEVFTTGTMGGITPVTAIDGRTIGSGTRGIITEKLQRSYSELVYRSEFSRIIPHFCTTK